MKTKNCAEIAVDQEYIEKVSSLRYKLTIDDMMRPKNEDKN